MKKIIIPKNWIKFKQKYLCSFFPNKSISSTYNADNEYVFNINFPKRSPKIWASPFFFYSLGNIAKTDFNVTCPETALGGQKILNWIIEDIDRDAVNEHIQNTNKINFNDHKDSLSVQNITFTINGILVFDYKNLKNKESSTLKSFNLLNVEDCSLSFSKARKLEKIKILTIKNSLYDKSIKIFDCPNLKEIDIRNNKLFTSGNLGIVWYNSSKVSSQLAPCLNYKNLNNDAKKCRVILNKEAILITHHIDNMLLESNYVDFDIYDMIKNDYKRDLFNYPVDHVEKIYDVIKSAKSFKLEGDSMSIEYGEYLELMKKQYANYLNDEFADLINCKKNNSKHEITNLVKIK